MARARGDRGHGQAGAGRRPRERLRTADDIKRELRRFIGDREEWPTDDEFDAAGEGELLARINELGIGMEPWMSALGFLTKEQVERYARVQREEDIRMWVWCVPRTYGFFPTDDKWLRVMSPELADRFKELGRAEFCSRYRVAPRWVMSAEEFTRRENEERARGPHGSGGT